MSIATVVDEVVLERRKQDAQWGGARHDDSHSMWDWLGLIKTFIFKADKAYSRYDGVEASSQVRRRLIQVAALCVAAVEAIDRRNDG